jgi:predicted small lipoprotein YifL
MRLLAVILSGSLVAACGQRGPLVLPVPPAEPPPRVRAPSSGTVVLPPARLPTEAAPGAPETERPARRTD